MIKEILQHVPEDWVNLTTHRLDIYEEEKAKTQFVQSLVDLSDRGLITKEHLSNLPTAYDYIRLGHPLSCLLELAISTHFHLPVDNVISFSSQTTPILAVLRKNLFLNKKTRVVYIGDHLQELDKTTVEDIYNYRLDVVQLSEINALCEYDGSTVAVYQFEAFNEQALHQIDQNEKAYFYVLQFTGLGSVLLINDKQTSEYISEIQHVRRRETIAMTPANCLKALHAYVGQGLHSSSDNTESKRKVKGLIRSITHTNTTPLVGSSGLSVQYAIMMGLIHNARLSYPEKPIRFVVPPNCYGGTNDQSRRVAACLTDVEVVDLPVDAGNDMVDGVEKVLKEMAELDAIPYIIAEIPTNPRVEVPDLDGLKKALSKERLTPSGKSAVPPVFILDQTFCPNINFLGEGQGLSTVQAISYASGSKFPSGGKCTAGYLVTNDRASHLLEKMAYHLSLCDNEATLLQYHILAEQLPSMLQRIKDAYDNTRSLVTYIEKILPAAKINFVSEELAAQGFTPSVFSLDLPTKGATEEEREQYKRRLNLTLIHKMIDEIPDESKYCVSYGQLKGCYWTVPATSTQGTTREGDKDYIVRVALSPDLDLDHHKAVFQAFVDEFIV